MFILKVTPIRNVLVTQRKLKSERVEMFFSKVVYENTEFEVYDVVERRYKMVNIKELRTSRHRVIINKKRFFVCSIKAS